MFQPIVLRESVMTLIDFPIVLRKPFTKLTDFLLLTKKKPPIVPPAEHKSLSRVLGIHKECGKPLLFFPTETYGIILCDSCNLRIVLPPSVETYADLRAFGASGAKYP